MAITPRQIVLMPLSSGPRFSEGHAMSGQMPGLGLGSELGMVLGLMNSGAILPLTALTPVARVGAS